MRIGIPVRTIVVEPLQLPLPLPAPEPTPEPTSAPEVEPEQVSANE